MLEKSIFRKHNRKNGTGRASRGVLAKYYWGDQFKKDEIGGTCGKHG
jgi:hypothetical protein